MPITTPSDEKKMARKKREFLERYVMARARTNANGMDGPGSLRDACRIWDELEKVHKTETNH